MSLAYWRVEPIWAGEAVVILGNGPSLTSRDIGACRGRARVIAINDALKRAPWADLHWFPDLRWWELRRGEPWYRDYRGIRATLENPEARVAEPGIRGLRFGGTYGLTAERDAICTGENSGCMCVNLAIHLGAKLILLLGFDLREVDSRRHWFGDYPWELKQDPHHFRERMLAAFMKLASAVSEARKFSVMNCTAGSALTEYQVFTYVPLEEALRWHEAAAPGVSSGAPAAR